MCLAIILKKEVAFLDNQPNLVSMRFLHDTNTFLQKAGIHAIQNKSNVSRSKAFFSHLEMSNDFSPSLPAVHVWTKIA